MPEFFLFTAADCSFAEYTTSNVNYALHCLMVSQELYYEERCKDETLITVKFLLGRLSSSED